VPLPGLSKTSQGAVAYHEEGMKNQALAGRKNISWISDQIRRRISLY
jgi:hypothetical protein